jgi:signal transduction histidine kinase
VKHGRVLATAGTGLVCSVLIAFTFAAPALAQPKRVLMLHSFGPDFGDEYAEELRAELDRKLPGGLELYESWLVSARFGSSDEDAPFASYLSALFADHPLDLIITIGAPAAGFVQRYRQPLFPTTPVLLADVDARRISAARLTENDTAVAFDFDFPAVVENILRVLPSTETLYVVIGNSPIEKYWIQEIGETLRPFAKRLNVVWLTEVPFDEVLRRVATLPPRSAILFALMSPNEVGVPKDEDSALAALHAVANAPMFNYLDTYFGKGVVGGPMISGDEFVQQAAGAAVRILHGERPTAVKDAPIRFAAPQYDWRELKRWHIRESDLPPGSAIRFRDLDVWEHYRWQIVGAAVFMVLQMVLIVSLLYERRRRKEAEIEAHQRLSELARMNRLSAVGELSASIAHELLQPLTGILANTETAQLVAASGKPDVSELREILTDIKRDQGRASEVIKRLRRLLAKAPIESQEIDLNELVREVLGLLSGQANARQATLHMNLAPHAPHVSGDPIQLQQVILNLVMNGLEAMSSAKSPDRRITGRTEILDEDTAQVSIEDTGPGIAAENVERIFEPFFTTKNTGMGMGLSIARNIIISHGGRMWAQNLSGGGAALRFTVPLAKQN